MTLELELLILAWDNYKKSLEEMSHLESGMDELMMSLLDTQEACQRIGNLPTLQKYNLK